MKTHAIEGVAIQSSLRAPSKKFLIQTPNGLRILDGYAFTDFLSESKRRELQINSLNKYNLEMQTSIDSINFSYLEALFAETLTPRGFEKEGHEYDGPFGSHYAEYVFKGKAYKLIADGREFKIVVDRTDNYLESHFGKG